MKPTLLILAAGMGSRYGSLKQMAAFGPNGESIIDYSIYDAIEAGFGKIVFIVREYFLEEFKARFDSRFGNKIILEYVCQEIHNVPDGLVFDQERTKPWGTGHAVLVAQDIIDTPFGIINADDFYGRESYKVLYNFLATDKSEDYCLVAYHLRNTLSEHGTVNRGVCAANEDNNLVAISETEKIGIDENGHAFYTEDDKTIVLADDTLVSMNMWGFKPNYFELTEKEFVNFVIEFGNNIKSEFYIPYVIDSYIKNNKINVQVLDTHSQWFGVTYPEDKPAVQECLNELIAKGEYPENIWA
jgi:dTDP-glucose pyrophosphorylase